MVMWPSSISVSGWIPAGRTRWECHSNGLFLAVPVPDVSLSPHEVSGGRMEQQKLLAALGEAGHSWEQVEPLERAEVSVEGKNAGGSVVWDVSLGTVLSPWCVLVTAAFLPLPPTHFCLFHQLLVAPPGPVCSKWHCWLHKSLLEKLEPPADKPSTFQPRFFMKRAQFGVPSVLVQHSLPQFPLSREGVHSRSSPPKHLVGQCQPWKRL